MTQQADPGQPGGPWAPAASVQPGPAPGLVYAGFWIRTLAFIIDAIALSILSAALAPLFGGSFVPVGNGRFEFDYGANALGTLISVIYFVGFWAYRGQTLGMMPFNLRVVRAEDGGQLDLVRALLRYVGLIISFAVILLGVIWVAFDASKQGWHDKMARTVVIRPG